METAIAGNTETNKDIIIRTSEQKYRELSALLDQKVQERTAQLLNKNEELQKSEERYHKMIAEVQDYAILLLDIDGNIMNWNKGAEKIKGYLEGEIIGKNFRIFYLPEDRADKLPEKLIATATTEGKAMHEGYRVRKDGTTFWGSIVITALHDEQNKVIGFSKVTRDLTERKVTEDKLKQYMAELEGKNNELSQYAYIASHDLQEPIRKIQTFAAEAENLQDINSIKNYLSKITGSADRMGQLIKGILKYTQLSSEREIFTDVDLNLTVKNIEQDFELLIKEKNARISYDKLPTIKGSQIQLYQLFLNLISNSLKFSEGPVIEITAAALTKDELLNYPELGKIGNYIKITVRDNGIGFDPSYSQQIFNLFSRLNNQKTYPGTGLGLALCKKIVENHNGIIFAEGNSNAGATFTVILPSA